MGRMNLKRFVLTLLFLGIIYSIVGQGNHTMKYIQRYKDMAVREMKRTGIPASITLAQGILESGSGKSRLATKGNNHFGIKCHKWTGRKIYEDDDRRNECFRKYNSVEASFRDHSNFLTGKKRYASLFRISSSNYKSWAKGLKRAGYATAWDYDRRLISLIERYKLYLYDTGKYKSSNISIAGGQNYTNSTSIKSRIRYRNRVPYFIIMKGDSLQKIENELGISRSKIIKYNDLYGSIRLGLGSPVYLKRKKRRTPKKYKIHIAGGNETMHDISQRYAIRLSVLLKNNGIKSNETPYKGQHVLLR